MANIDGEFKKIVREGGDWNDYDWSKPSLAVIASDGDDGWVVWHVGVHMAFDISEGVGSRRLEDLGIGADAPEGISIWEGKTKVSTSYEGEQDAWLDGSCRSPTDEEWAAIRKGECPWNDADWLKPEARERIERERAAESIP